ncbi:MAG TPA: hypothetical protein VGN57_17285 [Pirellulaceae bacterium]|nr:hypothetical protein [Pirellulaceae bacterium]
MSKPAWNYRLIGRYALSALGVLTLIALLAFNSELRSSPIYAGCTVATVVPLVIWPRWYMAPLVAAGVASLLGAF